MIDQAITADRRGAIDDTRARRWAPAQDLEISIGPFARRSLLSLKALRR